MVAIMRMEPIGQRCQVSPLTKVQAELEQAKASLVTPEVS